MQNLNKENGHEVEIIATGIILIIYMELSIAFLALYQINYNLEDASGEREQERWFREGGCLESHKMKSGNKRDCC